MIGQHRTEGLCNSGAIAAQQRSNSSAIAAQQRCNCGATEGCLGHLDVTYISSRGRKQESTRKRAHIGHLGIDAGKDSKERHLAAGSCSAPKPVGRGLIEAYRDSMDVLRPGIQAGEECDQMILLLRSRGITQNPVSMSNIDIAYTIASRYKHNLTKSKSIMSRPRLAMFIICCRKSYLGSEKELVDPEQVHYGKIMPCPVMS